MVLNNLPDKYPRIRPILAEITESLGSIFQKELLSIYVSGSYAQGLAKPESDLDIVFILRSEPSRPQHEMYLEQLRHLNAKWCPKDVYEVDMCFVIAPFNSDDSTIRRRFVLQQTGVLVHGAAIQNKVSSEYSPARIAAAFRTFHLAHIPAIRVDDPDITARTYARRAKAKYLLRELEWVAVLAGAPLSCRTADFLTHIKRYSPDHRQDAELCWRLYKKSYITDEELSELVQKEQAIIREFDQSVTQALKARVGAD